MEERQFHPLDYVSVLHRRKWWFIVPMVLCTIAGGLLAVFLPRTYRSVAEIGVAARIAVARDDAAPAGADHGAIERRFDQELLDRGEIAVRRRARHHRLLGHVVHVGRAPALEQPARGGEEVLARAVALIDAKAAKGPAKGRGKAKRKAPAKKKKA